MFLVISLSEYDSLPPRKDSVLDQMKVDTSPASTVLLHDVILPTVVTMFTVILSIAACILLLIIRRQWETIPAAAYRHHQVL